MTIQELATKIDQSFANKVLDLLESEDTTKKEKEKLLKYTVAAVGAGLVSAFIIYYFTREKKPYVIAACVEEKCIKRLRKELTKIPVKTPQTLKLISKVLEKCAVGPIWFDHYRIFKPTDFVKSYLRLIALIRAYIPENPGDGFFTNEELRKLYKILRLPAIKDEFCKVMQYTYSYTDKGEKSDTTVGSQETVVNCDTAYEYFKEAVNHCLAHGSGMYFGVAEYFPEGR